MAKKKDEVEVEKPPIAGDAGEAEEVPQIRKGWMLVKFLRPHFDREGKEDRALIGFEFSFPLTSDHMELLPKTVQDAYKYISGDDVATVGGISVSPQTVQVGLSPAEESVKLVAATIDKAGLTVVEEKGSGEVVTVIRFSFRAWVTRDKETIRFGTTHDGKMVWIRMRQAQASMIQE